MPKTLAELRASRAVALPERTLTICLAQGLVAEAQALSEEKVDLIVETQGPDEGAGKPRRAGQPEDVRRAEIEERLQALFAEMREHEGQLRIRGIETGEWVRWRDANPPRHDGVDEDGRPIPNAVDANVAYSWCNASALLADLGRYAVAWNDEPMTAEDWQFIASKAAPGDLKALVKLVVEMHEGSGSRAPKALSSPSSTSPTNATDSSLPAASESPNDAS